ncbi:unnamed protein product [Boreogadus saida]
MGPTIFVRTVALKRCKDYRIDFYRTFADCFLFVPSEGGGLREGEAEIKSLHPISA